MHSSFGLAYAYLDAHDKCVNSLLKAGASPMVFVKFAHDTIKRQIEFDSAKKIAHTKSCTFLGR